MNLRRSASKKATLSACSRANPQSGTRRMCCLPWQKAVPAGWYFEFNNEFYPDVDDTAMVLLALSRVNHPNERYQHESASRAIDWIFSMQCRGGGWGSFD